MVAAGDLFRQPCEFTWGAASADNFPPMEYPEVAFAGRSNVGKSTLLNALTKRKSLARTSKTPGCTRQINFYLLAQQIMLVDIPGYGYARASKSDIAKWNHVLQSYLLGRANLQRVFLLIDSRHAIKQTDLGMMAMLDEAAVSYQIVLTKVDKQKPKEIEKTIEIITELGENHPALYPEVLQTSGKEGKGRDEMRRAIAEFVK